MTKAQKAEIAKFVANLKEQNVRNPAWMDEGPSTTMCIAEAYELFDNLKKNDVALPAKMTPYYMACAWSKEV